MAEPVVQKNYLAQQCAISPELAQAIYDLLSAENQGQFSMTEVKLAAKTAHLVGKDLSFKSDKGRSFMGMAVPARV